MSGFPDRLQSSGRYVPRGTHRHTYCHTVYMKQKIHIAMDATVAEVVKRMANHEDRTFSNMITRLVVEAIGRREGWAEGLQSKMMDVTKGGDQ